MQLKKDTTEETPLFLETNTPQNHLDDETRIDIINNLMAINIHETSAKRIMDAVEKLPGKDHLKGALRFLTQLRQEKCQREEYYIWSHNVAEYFCTISNVGFFAVGAYSARFSILIAGTFSALSHAFPLQRFQQLDYLGVLGVFIEAASEYKAISERPLALAWGAGALAIGVFDAIPSWCDSIYPGCKKKYMQEHPTFKDVISPTLHATWHTAAAFSLLMFYLTMGELNREPSKAEQTTAVIWGSIGIILCLLPLFDVAMKKTYGSCKSTFFSNTNDTQNDNNTSNVVQLTS